jgi:NadR type nicotinamide-nucleotide adenylyltransferase
VLRVVLIGPESTGKTRLADELAARYGVPWSPEYAREYVTGREEPLTREDVDAIGRGQKAGEDAVLAQAKRLERPLVFHDTDLVSTWVYSRHYYGDCPAWIEAEARERLADLYLLHHVDVDWVADGLQREQPGRRKELFERFRTTLESLRAVVSEVRGSWDERKRRAIHSIDRLRA